MDTDATLPNVTHAQRAGQSIAFFSGAALGGVYWGLAAVYILAIPRRWYPGSGGDAPAPLLQSAAFAIAATTVGAVVWRRVHDRRIRNAAIMVTVAAGSGL